MNYMYCLCILFHKIKMSLFKNEKNLSVRLFISHNKYTLTQNFFYVIFYRFMATTKNKFESIYKY